MVSNLRIRLAITESGLKQYEVASALNIAEETFSRKLRTELPEDEQKRIINIISSIKK